MGFFNDLKKIANNEMAKSVISGHVKGLFKSNDSQGVSNTVVKEETGLSVSNLSIDWQTGLTNDVKEVDYLGTKICHRLRKPTNFYITNDDFGAAEVANVYIYSKNGETLDYGNIDTMSYTRIFFGEWEYNPENPDTVTQKIRNFYKIENINIVNENSEYLKYRVHGESDKFYYDSYLYKTGAYVKIELLLNKDQLTADQIQDVLNEFYSIINTVEIKETSTN